MTPKEPRYRRRIPKGLKAAGAPSRTLHDTFVRSLELTSTLDAERGAILIMAFSHVFEVPVPKFTFALRRWRRGATLHAAAKELLALTPTSRRPRSRDRVLND